MNYHGEIMTNIRNLLFLIENAYDINFHDGTGVVNEQR